MSTRCRLDAPIKPISACLLQEHYSWPVYTDPTARKSYLASACRSHCLHSLKVLLVPPTDVLLHGRDQDSGLAYSELTNTEEFLGSHVLRVPNPPAVEGGKDTPNIRENRGKAKQFTTFNGRTVIIKESSIFSNKGGFANLCS
jgi:hypothetical protein